MKRLRLKDLQDIKYNMKVFQVQCAPWDRVHLYTAEGYDIKQKDYVIVKTDLGIDIVRVIGILEYSSQEIQQLGDIQPIVRKASESDIEKMNEREKTKQDDYKVCLDFIKKRNLDMKLIDVHYSYDSGRLTFAFIAEARVDFRDLVKDLTKYFHKSIRLQQLGVRDAARFAGDVGPCSKELCCKKYLKSLSNVTTDMAELQQVAHRGSERLSGVCGRLKCCLSYELDIYKKNVKDMPPIGSSVKTEDKEGKVTGWHILKRTIDLQIQGAEYSLEVPVDKLTVIKLPDTENV